MVQGPRGRQEQGIHSQIQHPIARGQCLRRQRRLLLSLAFAKRTEGRRPALFPLSNSPYGDPCRVNYEAEGFISGTES